LLIDSYRSTYHLGIKIFKRNDYRSAGRVFRSLRARGIPHIDPSPVIQASSVVALKDRAQDKERISNQVDQVGRQLLGLLEEA